MFPDYIATNDILNLLKKQKLQFKLQLLFFAYNYK
jgi:hypothetical protein